jgi:hypothetical protein
VALGFAGLESAPLDPAGIERTGRALLERRDDLEQAVQLEQGLAGLGFELPPEPERLLGKANVFLLPICEPEDARATVTGAAVVAEPVLLLNDDFVPALRQGTAGRKAHHPRSNDGDLHLVGRSPLLAEQ